MLRISIRDSEHRVHLLALSFHPSALGPGMAFIAVPGAAGDAPVLGTRVIRPVPAKRARSSASIRWSPAVDRKPGRRPCRTVPGGRDCSTGVSYKVAC
jgi:hypothetical protein